MDSLLFNTQLVNNPTDNSLKRFVLFWFLPSVVKLRYAQFVSKLDYVVLIIVALLPSLRLIPCFDHSLQLGCWIELDQGMNYCDVSGPSFLSLQPSWQISVSSLNVRLQWQKIFIVALSLQMYNTMNLTCCHCHISLSLSLSRSLLLSYTHTHARAHPLMHTLTLTLTGTQFNFCSIRILSLSIFSILFVLRSVFLHATA